MGGLVRNGQGSLLVFRALTQGPEVGTSLRARTGFRADPSPPQAAEGSTPNKHPSTRLFFGAAFSCPDLLVGGGLRRTRGLGPLPQPRSLAASGWSSRSSRHLGGGGRSLSCLDPRPSGPGGRSGGCRGPPRMESSETRGLFAALPLPRGARGAGRRRRPQSVHASSQASEDRFLWDSSSSFDDGNQRHLTLDGTKTYGR